MRRRVLRLPLSRELAEAEDKDRRARFPRLSPAEDEGFALSIRLGSGERERERLVDMVDTESEEYDETDLERLREESRARFRPRSSSFWARISSATPFFRSRSLGTSVVSFGFSFGFSSCWVREGRDL